MTYRVVIEPTAEREIRAIVRWKTQNASPTIAARWYNGLLKKVGTLRTHPARCPVAAENDEFPFEIREILHGRRRDVFRIIFTIRDDTVSILFVHHSAQQELEP
jgi:plasmid stabilization system protein ParE